MTTVKVWKVTSDNRNLSKRNKELSKSENNEHEQNLHRSEYNIKAENKKKRENSSHEMSDEILNSQMKDISEMTHLRIQLSCRDETIKDASVRTYKYV